MMRFMAQTLDVNTHLLAVVGELEPDGGDRLMARVDALDTGVGDHVVIDLTDMSFLASAALASIVGASMLLRERGSALTLVVPTGSRAHYVFEVTGLLRRLSVVGTRAEAIAGW
jgi:anti-anti-sigma factor